MLERQKREVRKDLKVKEKQNREITDWLAMERTLYANERTFLAYVRTSLALVISGFTLLKFFNELFFDIAGIGFINLGIFVAVLGYRKYSKKQAQIINTKHAYTPTSPAHADILEDEQQHPNQM